MSYSYSCLTSSMWRLLQRFFFRCLILIPIWLARIGGRPFSICLSGGAEYFAELSLCNDVLIMSFDTKYLTLVWVFLRISTFSHGTIEWYQSWYTHLIVWIHYGTYTLHLYYTTTTTDRQTLFGWRPSSIHSILVSWCPFAPVYCARSFHISLLPLAHGHQIRFRVASWTFHEFAFAFADCSYSIHTTSFHVPRTVHHCPPSFIRSLASAV